METLDTYLTQLASSSATPGGGSAAMFVAATGCALLAMVCRISAANPKFTDRREAAERLVAEADALRTELIGARERDERAFDAVVDAQRLPKENDAQKTARGIALEHALQHAAEVPLQLAARVLHALQLLEEALSIENKNLLSDLGCAAEFCHAAIRSCAYNVRINHKYMKSAGSIAPQTQALARLETEADERLERIRTAVEEGSLS